jgi:hypothetical protein
MLRPVKQKTTKPGVEKRFREKLLRCWPALKGSLAEVFKPCTRPHCPACARGDKHPNYLLAFSEKGRRRCLYVPKAMVPVLQRALQNGRRLEQLLYAMGPALVQEYRAQNPAQTGPAARTTPRRQKSKS